MCILIQPTVANLCISEGTFDDGKDMFHFRSDLGLGQVTLLRRLVQRVVATTFLMSEILRKGGHFTYRLGLTAICRVTPYRVSSPCNKSSSTCES